MLLLIILLLLSGGLMVYVAQNNLVLVTLHLGSYAIANIPLFYVIIGSLLAGLILAYGVYLVNSVVMSLKMFGKDKKIKETKDEVADLTELVHKLENENKKLKAKSSLDNI